MGGAFCAEEVWPCWKLGPGEDADPPKSRCALPRGFFVSGASVTAESRDPQVLAERLYSELASLRAE